MAPQGITASHDQESHRPTTQSEGDSPTQNEPNINFGNFATYIAELGNITSKFPEIFQALEDMSKTDNDIDKLNIFLVGVARSSPPTPTRYGYNSASTLDFAITKNADWPCIVTSRSELSSDHNPVTKIITKFEQKQWDESLACLEAEDGTLWNAVRNFRKKAPQIPALKGSAKIAYSDTDKSEIIADSLQNQFKLNDIKNDTDRTITHVVYNYLENENNFTNTPPIPPPLPSEIIEYINSTKVKKAAGIDRISNRMLKNLPLISIFELTNIITNVIKLGYFPQSWKTAAVIPILKPGKDPTKADCFRHIALLSVLGKVAEKIILTRMCHHVDSTNLIIPEQHGFRPNLLTSHQLLRVVETVRSGRAPMTVQTPVDSDPDLNDGTPSGNRSQSFIATATQRAPSRNARKEPGSLNFTPT
ncbi:RNA-directed DNA polymerase from mobile element jockey [Trichonephila clavipes]|nr:RNA-directed DNA polymerase from mobile element jockey [Trichonephila clavipes]